MEETYETVEVHGRMDDLGVPDGVYIIHYDPHYYTTRGEIWGNEEFIIAEDPETKVYGCIPLVRLIKRKTVTVKEKS